MKNTTIHTLLTRPLLSLTSPRPPLPPPSPPPPPAPGRRGAPFAHSTMIAEPATSRPFS